MYGKICWRVELEDQIEHFMEESISRTRFEIKLEMNLDPKLSWRRDLKPQIWNETFTEGKFLGADLE